MAEYRDFPDNQENVNERGNDAAVPELFANELLLDVVQNIQAGENLMDAIVNRRIPDDENLLISSVELKEIIIYLLEMQLKLCDIKHKKFKEELKSCLDGLNNIILRFENLPNEQKSNEERNRFQEKLDSLTATRKELEDFTEDVPICEDDEDKFLAELHEDFLNFQEAYRKCVSHIQNFLQNAENNLKISNVPRECQEELCVLFSILEENLASFNTIFLSSKEEFEKFEYMLKNELQSPCQSWKDRINLYITVIKKAELSYRKLKPLIFDIINFESAISRNF